MKITSVTIEGMHNVEKKKYTFSDLNYLFGENGTGKSTVLQGIQLGLLGYIPGYNKTKESIFQHANSHTMAITLDFDDGSQIQRIWTNSAKGVLSAFHTKPNDLDIANIIGDLELPVFNFNEFAGMTANKLKDWFINFLPSSSIEIDWEKELKESAERAGIRILDEELPCKVIDEIKSYNLTGLDEVRKANEYLKSLLSFNKQNLERVQNTVQTLVYKDIHDARDPEEIKAEICSLQNEMLAIQDYAASVKRNTYIDNQLAQLKYDFCDSCESDTKYQEALAEQDKYKKEESDLSAMWNEAVITKNELSVRIASLKQSNDNGAICPILQEPCSKIAEKSAKAAEELKKLNIEFEAARRKEAELSEELKAAGKKYIEAIDAVRTISGMYSSKELLENQRVPVPEYEPIRSIEDCQSRIIELNGVLATLESNARYDALINEFTAEQFKIAQSIEVIKCWIKLTDANGLQTQMSSEPFMNMEAKISETSSKLFGSDVKIKFNLSEKANSFSFGIIRGDTYVPYDLLSSGEKCLFAICLLIAIVKDSTSAIKVILIDDLLDHLDDNNIATLFTSLKSISDVQFIFAGVKSCDTDCVIEVR